MTGSNHTAWRDAIMAYLKSQGVWRICSRSDKWPIDLQLGSPSQDIMDCIQLQALWDNQNNQAEGYILLWLSPQCIQAVAGKNTAKDIWTELQKVFGVQGPSQLYANFKLATTHRVRVNDPAPDLLEIARTFGRLMAAMVNIPPIIQVMILLNTLLHEFENISQILLQMETISTLTFKLVQDSMLSDHTRRSNHLGSSSNKALKLSNVKPKGANPKWQPRKGDDYKGKQKESSAEPHEQ